MAYVQLNDPNWDSDSVWDDDPEWEPAEDGWYEKEEEDGTITRKRTKDSASMKRFTIRHQNTENIWRVVDSVDGEEVSEHLTIGAAATECRRLNDLYPSEKGVETPETRSQSWDERIADWSRNRPYISENRPSPFGRPTFIQEEIRARREREQARFRERAAELDQQRLERQRHLPPFNVPTLLVKKKAGICAVCHTPIMAGTFAWRLGWFRWWHESHGSEGLLETTFTKQLADIRKEEPAKEEDMFSQKRKIRGV